MQPVQPSHSISRKPVPVSPTEQPGEVPFDNAPVATPQSNNGSRNNSLLDAFIDQDALERMLDNDRTSTMHSAASTEPDYASTVSSNHEERTPVERPRAGKLKTVGNPDLAQHDPNAGRFDPSQYGLGRQNADVPNINFGPTYAYKPTGRPGTSGTINATGEEGRSRSRSKDRLRSSGRNTPGGLSPGEDHRHSYFGDNPNRHSVAWTPSGGSPIHQQRQSLTPEQWVAQRAAMASQPQYAPQSAQPGFAHQRTGSSGSFNALQLRKSMTKTPPPFGRAHSGDWSQQVPDQRTPPSRPHSRGASIYLNQMSNTAQQGHSNPPSRPHSRSASMYLDQATALAQQTQPTPPSRPNSRSAGRYLNQQLQPPPPTRPKSRSAGMYLAQPSGLVQSSQPASLSAREQMHVARATGTSLLDTSANARKKQNIDEKASAGLVGAIGAREREKAAMKTSHRSSMVVENAIRARQDQQVEAQTQAYQQQMQQMQQQAMYYGQQQGYVGPGTLGTQYGYATPTQMQQQQDPQQQYTWQQQQQQGAYTPGNRQSTFGGSYFGQPPYQGGQ